jgi:hypothetical protein
VLADRTPREPVDPVCDPMERFPVDEHLDGLLVDAGVSGLLCGNEAVLLGRDIPQHRSSEGLGGHRQKYNDNVTLLTALTRTRMP